MPYTGLAHPIEAVALDQLDDPLETRPDVVGQRIERRRYPPVEELNPPAHPLIYHFCDMQQALPQQAQFILTAGL
jgi:hypothetical protein